MLLTHPPRGVRLGVSSTVATAKRWKEAERPEQPKTFHSHALRQNTDEGPTWRLAEELWRWNGTGNGGYCPPDHYTHTGPPKRNNAGKNLQDRGLGELKFAPPLADTPDTLPCCKGL